MVSLKFLNFNPVLRTIGHALKMAAADLAAFTVMIFITITAFGKLGVFLFGGSNENFKDLSTAFLTMVRIIFRDFDYFELEDVFYFLGPVFFLTYVMLIFFVLLNMFLAVIILSFRTATKTVTYKPNFFWYYIKRQLYRVTNGLLNAPKYPKIRDGIALNQQLNAKKLRELRLIRNYKESEEHLDILLSRLDLIENIFYRLTHNMDDLIEKAKHYNKNVKPAK
ncbi:uncharacterized protein LOC117784903 [Drosophila innubila]|uniref:uncharacterized protein LOC117784903 n=1 Tax=Drosophila innubila TaxID=198719 RepID=UPI00148E7560|nr:uncharacterized protein LOC117784903 [Drosophila innubila]